MNVAVIGYGSIGRRHAGNLVTHSEEFGVDVLHVCDIGRYPVVPDTEFPITVHINLASIWETEPDLVMICTPPALHIPQAVEAVKASVSHIFIEKPLALTLSAIDPLRDALEATGYDSDIMVACNLRFHPEIERWKKVGNIRTLELRMSAWLDDWRPDRTLEDQADVIPGVVLDSIHEIDLAIYMAGPVVDFSAYVANYHCALDVEDTAKIIMRHDRKVYPGALTSIHLSYFEQDQDSPSRVSPRSTQRPRREITIVETGGHVTTLVLNPTNEMYVNELRHLLGCVRDGTQPMNGLAEASEVLKWAIEARTEGALV